MRPGRALRNSIWRAVLVGESREQGGAAVELFEFAGELQQYRAPGEGVRDHLRLPERPRVRDPSALRARPRSG
jgi:hypothetical protein